MKHHIYHSNDRERGFTLVETLVALTLLTLAIVPLLSMAFAATSVADSLRNDITAAGLAQEGIEVVRAVRDTNWFNGLPAFDANMTAGDHMPAWNDEAVAAPWRDVPLKIDANGVYNYAVGTDTAFKRKVTLTRVSSVEMKVVSEVTWQERNRSRNVRVEADLFDWK